MNIGVFSKFEMAGGSERRCVEMANALARYSPHQALLFAEGPFPASLEAALDSRVRLRKHALVGTDGPTDLFDGLDCLLVVNTDSKDFCRAAYWRGESGRHAARVDIGRIPRLVFLFNFIVSPSQHLWELEAAGARLQIITANRKFLDEIGDQPRYRRVRHIVRTSLESPIDPAGVPTGKSPSPALRIGMHSTSNGDKWNDEWPRLIDEVNRRCGDSSLLWRFMGMPGPLRAEAGRRPGVEAVAERTRPVADFLRDLDLFVFFTSWKREEPWSRSVAEALMSGCPVVATPRGGNPDQIVSGNNGLLSKTFDEFVDSVVLLVENAELRARMSADAIRRASEFTSERVIGKFLEFVEP